MIERSSNMKWYSGPTLIDAIDSLEKPQRYKDKPFRLPLWDAYKIGGIGTVVVGRVETGTLKKGMLIAFAPSDIIAECKTIERFYESQEEAQPGDIIGFHVKN